MTKATEASLGGLHGVVATVLTSQIQHQVEETTFDEDGKEVATGEYVYTVAPATMAAAIKFLKDNSITADIETDQNMGSLKDALEKKQRHSRLGSASKAALQVVG